MRFSIRLLVSSLPHTLGFFCNENLIAEYTQQDAEQIFSSYALSFVARGEVYWFPQSILDQ